MDFNIETIINMLSDLSLLLNEFLNFLKKYFLSA